MNFCPTVCPTSYPTTYPPVAPASAFAVSPTHDAFANSNPFPRPRPRRPRPRPPPRPRPRVGAWPRQPPVLDLVDLRADEQPVSERRDGNGRRRQHAGTSNTHVRPPAKARPSHRVDNSIRTPSNSCPGEEEQRVSERQDGDGRRRGAAPQKLTFELPDQWRRRWPRPGPLPWRRRRARPTGT